MNILNQSDTVCFLDGAMGTELLRSGLKLGRQPEVLNFTAPETVTAIHRSYIDAGSNIIYTNTFGANARKLAGCGYTPAQIIHQAVRLARSAADGRDVKVALDIGPIGELLEPLGTLSFDEAYEMFREMAVSGQQAGADLVVLETMSDLGEVRAGVLAAKENTTLPVFVTMTFEENRRTFTGCTIPSMALTLEGLGVDAMGINCSLGPMEVLPLVEELAQWTRLPIIVKPNAGLPDPETNQYHITPEEFARDMAPFVSHGARYLGGCCGTDPDFLRALCGQIRNVSPVARSAPIRRGVCCAGQTVSLDGVRVIGERINPTGKKRFQQALREHDLDYILRQAMEQQEAGADILDVNVGLPGIDEPALMSEVVQAIQAVVPLPLQIDSSNPAAIEAGLRACHGKAIVNSVNGKAEVLNAVLPIVKKYGAAVVGLSMDENGIPQTAEERFAIARRILDAALVHGIPREDVFIDCLTLTVSAQQRQAKETLRAVRMVKEELGLHNVLGVSNISFGLPERIQLTQTFLVQAMECGLDLPIVNPNQKPIMDAVAAFRVLSGEDEDAERYIQRFQNAPTAPAPAVSVQMDLPTAVIKGLPEACKTLTEQLLQTTDEMTVINDLLIPALDEVGRRYERQEIFLPQLINSANASCQAFEVIKTAILHRGGAQVSRGKILLATVEGDIHDIGKNIVKVILENYGFQVIDLGRDVPVQRVVETAIREDIHLVGLSALMTTTVESMARTIQALRSSGHDCKIMVGGAVLTPEYAAEIGADFYAKDARESAEIAKRVLGKR